MNVIMDELMSISSNSLSVSDETKIRPPPKRAKKNVKRKPAYKIVRIPKRIFQQIQRKLKKNKPVIDIKTQTVEKENCNRFILNQIQGDQMETVSPESTTRLMWEIRERLQRKEYGDLARLISIFTEMPIGKMRWYSTLLKYCLIALLYDPLVQGTELMDMFLDGVIGCRSDEEKKNFLHDINRLPANIHVTKYDNLWSEYPLQNQLNQQSVDQLCEVLNERMNIKPEPDDENVLDNDSDWETFDENTSGDDNDDDDDDDNETTTEPEQVCDFSDVLKRLQKQFAK